MRKNVIDAENSMKTTLLIEREEVYLEGTLWELEYLVLTTTHSNTMTCAMTA